MSETEPQPQFVCTACGQELAAAAPSGCSECEGTVVPMGSDVEVGPGRILGRRYVLLEPLGRGAMGAVYLANQRALDKRVAIKVMALGLSGEHALKRFYQEAQNAAQLEHPHNVKVFDFGHDEGDLAYLVMEVVRGRPLSKVPLPLPQPRALRIGAQICRALIEAHDRGLVHRDLKPDNVMLTELDGEDFARVLDYGIAKAMNGSGTVLTRTGMMIGTPRYISPEQAQGDEIDVRSDIYSFGAMLFELVTGRPPFDEPNPIALALAHIGKPPPRPSALTPMPEPLDVLITSCLAKSREERPQTMREVLETLRGLLGVSGGLLLTGEHERELQSRETRPAEVLGARLMAVGQTQASAVGTAEREGTERVPQPLPELWPGSASWRRRGVLAAAAVVIAGLVGAALGGGSDDESQPAVSGVDASFEIWPSAPSAPAEPVGAALPFLITATAVADDRAPVVEEAAKPIFEVWPSFEPAADEVVAASEPGQADAQPSADDEVADRGESPAQGSGRGDDDDDEDDERSARRSRNRRPSHRGRSHTNDDRPNDDRREPPSEEPSGPTRSNPDVIDEIERGIRSILR